MARKSFETQATELAKEMGVSLHVQHEWVDCPFAVEIVSESAHLRPDPQLDYHLFLVEKSMWLDDKGYLHEGTEPRVWREILLKLNDMNPCPSECSCWVFWPTEEN